MYKYPKTVRVLHWLTAALVCMQVVVGLLMEDFEPLLYVHITIGTLIFLTTLARAWLRWRPNASPPSRPGHMSGRQWWFAQKGHDILLALLLLAALSGIFAVLYHGPAEEIHEVLVYSFITVVLGHIAAALKHIMIDRNNIMRRIT